MRTRTRTLIEGDLDDFYDIVGNPNVMRYVKPVMDLKESKEELNKFINLTKRKDIFYKIWAVESLDSTELVGICGVYENDDSEMEIAYRLKENFWGYGYGSEIAKGLIEYCLKSLKIQKLVAYVHPDNIGSVKILQNLMIYTGMIETKSGFEKKFEISIKTIFFSSFLEDNLITLLY